MAAFSGFCYVFSVPVYFGGNSSFSVCSRGEANREIAAPSFWNIASAVGAAVATAPELLLSNLFYELLA